MAKKYKALTGVTYDDGDFGRTHAKPGTILLDLSAEAAKELLAVKAIAEVNNAGEDPGDSEELRLARAEAERIAAAEAAKAQQDEADAEALQRKQAADDAVKDEAANAAAKLQAVTAEAEGMTKAQLAEALTKGKVEFDGGANKAALVEAYVAFATK